MVGEVEEVKKCENSRNKMYEQDSTSLSLFLAHVTLSFLFFFSPAKPKGRIQRSPRGKEQHKHKRKRNVREQQRFHTKR